MPLGQGIGELMGAVRDRIEVSGHGPTWEVSAGSFEQALAYARERFGEPTVLGRKDRARWWPRVTLTVTTDPALAETAPALEDIARPVVPEQAQGGGTAHAAVAGRAALPSSLEEIFAHQEELRIARQRGAEEHTQAS